MYAGLPLLLDFRRQRIDYAHGITANADGIFTFGQIICGRQHGAVFLPLSVLLDDAIDTFTAGHHVHRLDIVVRGSPFLGARGHIFGAAANIFYADAGRCVFDGI